MGQTLAEYVRRELHATANTAPAPSQASSLSSVRRLVRVSLVPMLPIDYPMYLVYLSDIEAHPIPKGKPT